MESSSCVCTFHTSESCWLLEMKGKGMIRKAYYVLVQYFGAILHECVYHSARAVYEISAGQAKLNFAASATGKLKGRGWGQSQDDRSAKRS